MPEYDSSNLTNLGQMKKLAQRTKDELGDVESRVSNALKAASFSNNTLRLFRTTDTSQTPAFTFNLPAEMFLDQANTKFEAVFAWSLSKYPGSTNPNLDGKPVMVLAVESGETNPSFSFLDMAALVDSYSAGDASVVVNSFTISVQISNTAGNALSLESGKGLYVDISGKADKVSSATNGNLAKLDASGNLADTGIAATDVVTKVANPASDNLVAQDANGKIKDAGIAKGDVVTKIASPTTNNFVAQDSNGKIKDAGMGLASDTDVDNMILDVFGTAAT